MLCRGNQLMRLNFEKQSMRVIDEHDTRIGYILGPNKRISVKFYRYIMSLRQNALNAYRNGLRATRIAFNGDTRMLLASRAKMREGMENPPNPELSKEQQIKHLEDVATFLKRNLVQGRKEGSEEKYHLNIHKETELGDNESIKKAKSTLASEVGGCCGGGKRLYK